MMVMDMMTCSNLLAKDLLLSIVVADLAKAQDDDDDDNGFDDDTPAPSSSTCL